MVFADARCEECNHIFGIEKANTMDDFVIGNCPKCGSNRVYRKFGIGTFSVCQGLVGNSRNSYENTLGVYHVNELCGKSKGVKYSSMNKNNK